MPESFQLTVLSPTRTLMDEPVESIIAPGADGYLGVLAHHAPLITTLRPGKLTVRDLSGQTRVYALGGGFLEVSQNRATILADSLEEPERIDLERARRSAERARGRLKDTSAEIDRDRAELALERAQNRIRVATESRQGG
jgi:F-type H+-transporting ATPase subunit epsilon